MLDSGTPVGLPGNLNPQPVSQPPLHGAGPHPWLFPFPNPLLFLETGEALSHLCVVGMKVWCQQRGGYIWLNKWVNPSAAPSLSISTPHLHLLSLSAFMLKGAWPFQSTTSLSWLWFLLKDLGCSERNPTPKSLWYSRVLGAWPFLWLASLLCFFLLMSSWLPPLISFQSVNTYKGKARLVLTKLIC